MADDTVGQEPKRRSGKPFPKGKSGNPAGRPAGSRNTTTVAIEKLLDGEAAAITRTCIDRAKAGDSIALRLVMERVAPLRRGRPVQFELPPIDKASDLAIALGGILRAAASGALTPEEAATVAGILETKRRAIETGELENRLIQLEERLSK